MSKARVSVIMHCAGIFLTWHGRTQDGYRVDPENPTAKLAIPEVPFTRFQHSNRWPPTTHALFAVCGFVSSRDHMPIACKFVSSPQLPIDPATGKPRSITPAFKFGGAHELITNAKDAFAVRPIVFATCDNFSCAT